MEETLRLCPDCIRLEVDADDWKEAIRKACKPLIDNRFVTEEYPQDVIDREMQWATGLPTEPFGVAIPHALTPEHVLQAQVAACRLTKPVPFHQSGGTPGEDDILCKIVFILALKDPHAQLNLLQKLMVVISEEELLERLEKAGNPQEFSDIFSGASVAM